MSNHVENQKDILVKYAASIISTLSHTENLTEYSSSEDESNFGSEFGDGIKLDDLNTKLPQVKKEISTMLKINDPDILNNKISIIHVSKGTTLCKEGDYVKKLSKTKMVLNIKTF